MRNIIDIAARSAKALVAAAAPILTTAVVEILAELGKLATVGIAAAATAAGVWLAPNRPAPDMSPSQPP